jgi:hypothetical protein
VLTGADGVRYPLGRLAVGDHHVIDGAGRPHPRRFALGAWVGRGLGTSGFTRPRANAAPLRTGDAPARAMVPAEERGNRGAPVTGPGTAGRCTAGQRRVATCRAR